MKKLKCIYFRTRNEITSLKVPNTYVSKKCDENLVELFSSFFI